MATHIQTTLFPDFSQPQLLFYFLQLLHAKLSFHVLSNHNLHAIASYVMHIEFTLITFISFCSKWNRLKIASI